MSPALHWQLISFSGVHSFAGWKNRFSWRTFGDSGKAFTRACAIETGAEEEGGWSRENDL